MIFKMILENPQNPQKNSLSRILMYHFKYQK